MTIPLLDSLEKLDREKCNYKAKHLSMFNNLIRICFCASNK